jgi:DNA-binding NarL/FixJ family response regulator
MRMGAGPRRVEPVVARGAAGSDAPLVAAYAAHVAGRLAGDGAALLAAADAFEAIGAVRYAVEAAADAARAFVDGGRHDSARRALARSRDLFGRGQGGAAPLVDGLDGPASALTAREAQLVELARRGLSNAAIAEQLVLSVRTVESHLYRAMHKLGVGDRRDL